MRYGSKKTQPNAKRHCIGLGGRLMEIRSQHDHDKATQMRQGSVVWIGVKKNSGRYKWLSNGERMDMTQFWESGRPDSGAECVAMRGSGFTDDRCTKTFAFLCEFY